jgi:hypothetical protein
MYTSMYVHYVRSVERTKQPTENENFENTDDDYHHLTSHFRLIFDLRS